MTAKIYQFNRKTGTINPAQSGMAPNSAFVPVPRCGGPMKTEVLDYLKFPLFYFGLAAAFADGLAVAQVWDWITTTGRLSIWVLL